MAFELIPLPYAEDALEPAISAKTLSFHHGKHHKAYVDKTNSLIEGTELDGKPLNLSDRMLLTTTGKVENTGQSWNARHAMLSNWGTAPTLIEPITGWIQLKDLEGAIGVSAQALDGSARPVPAISKAVPWSGEVRTKGRPSVTFTALSKASVLIGISA